VLAKRIIKKRTRTRPILASPNTAQRFPKEVKEGLDATVHYSLGEFVCRGDALIHTGRQFLSFGRFRPLRMAPEKNSRT